MIKEKSLDKNKHMPKILVKEVSVIVKVLKDHEKNLSKERNKDRKFVKIASDILKELDKLAEIELEKIIKLRNKQNSLENRE